MNKLLIAIIVFGLAFISQALAFARKPTIKVIEYSYEFKDYTYKCVTCTEREKDRIERAEKIIRSCINNPKFFQWWDSFKRIEQNKGLSSSQIASMIRNRGLKDIPIVYYSPSLFQSKKVVGYTYPNQPEIYLNRAFRGKNWTTWAEASNLFHETLHKIGFEHDFKDTERRPYSVPYLGNRVIEMCEKEYTQ